MDHALRRSAIPMPIVQTHILPARPAPTAKKYGPKLMAYTIYQIIELRLPQNRVAPSMNKLFGLYISRNTTNRFKSKRREPTKCTYDDS